MLYHFLTSIWLNPGLDSQNHLKEILRNKYLLSYRQRQTSFLTAIMQEEEFDKDFIFLTSDRKFARKTLNIIDLYGAIGFPFSRQIIGFSFDENKLRNKENIFWR
jgi:hypothetical protein